MMSEPERVGPFFKYADAAEHLRRPFTPEATRWKLQSALGVQNKDPKTAKGGMIVAYIDARLVIERLNLLTPEWEDHYAAEGQDMRCALMVCNLSRVGFGTGKDYKSRESDSLKRAAVKFGVGVSLYALAQVTLWRAADSEPAGNKLRPNYKGVLELDDANKLWLKDRYAAWLETDRGKHFGAPLDHGDMFGAVGDEPVAEDVPAAVSVADAAELEKARADVEQAYEALREVAPRKLTPARYRARVEAANGDAAAMGRLLAEIQSWRDHGLAAQGAPHEAVAT